MKIKINNKQIKIKPLHIMIALIIGLFVGYIASDLQYNTAFVDEAIYATVGEEYLQGHTWEAAIGWMGGSYLYPIVSALINRHFGLWGIRMFALFCMLGTSWGVYQITKLISKSAAIYSVVLFLFSSYTLDLAQLGTYDGPSLLFSTVGAYTALSTRQDSTRKKILKAILSGILFALAILSKYVAVLVAPAIGLYWLMGDRKHFLAGLIWAFTIWVMMVPYVAYNISDLQAYANGNYSIETTSYLEILKQTVLGIPVILACLIPTSIFIFKSSTTTVRKFALIFLLGALSPFFYHLLSQNARSYWKHLVFVSVYLAPLAGWGIYQTQRQISWMIHHSVFFKNTTQIIFTIAFILTISAAWLNFTEHWRFQRSWPSVDQTVAFLKGKIQPNDRVFAEGAATFKYHLFVNIGDPIAWPSTWYFEHDGQTGTDAMKAAIQEKQFRYIILNDYFTAGINQQLMPDIQTNYQIIFEEPYKIQGNYEVITTVWERNPESEDGFGQFLSQSQP